MGARNTGDEERRSYLAFLTAFTVSVVLYVIRLYVEENLGGAGVTFVAVWGAVDGLVDLAVVVTGVVFFHALYEISFRRRVLWPLLALSLGVYLVFLISGLRSLAASDESIRPGLYLALGYYYLLFAYLIGLNLIHLRTLSGARKRFFGYGLFLFLLVGAVESALSHSALFRSLAPRARAWSGWPGPMASLCTPGSAVRGIRKTSVSACVGTFPARP